MRYFKLKTGASAVYDIDKETFEDKTFRKEPYYSINSYGKPVQYAVCPHCDNPIQIIGLYKKIQNSEFPYGRHHPHSIPGLATYNQQAYDYCPYAKKTISINKELRKEKITDYERNIYNLAREQFDRIMYLLFKKTDVKFSYNLAEKMLKCFIENRGWLYPWTTPTNLPYMVGYFGNAKPLYGQCIVKDSPLYQAIVNNCPSAVFLETSSSKYVKLSSKPNEWVNIEFCFMKHKRSVNDEIMQLTETIDFCVRELTGKRENRFYTKTLEIDEKYFLNLVSLPQERSQRNLELLKVAKKIMPDL